MIARLTAALSLAGALLALAPATGWTRFYSAKYRFFTFYPPGWHILSASDWPRLEVINFPTSEAGHGTVLTEDGADIMVIPPAEPGGNIDDLVAQSIKFVHDPPSIDQTILTRTTDPNHCPTLRQVSYYENLGTELTPVLEQVTTYYCEVHNRIFRVTLTYYRGNKDTDMLEGLARTVVDTLRVYK
ncbi:MAG TPA: hypothetical protein VIE13_03440 [Terriglobales bacterium]|jgi:hypothetical protein